MAMNPAVSISNTDGVALIRIDNPPVNALSQEVIDGLGAAIDAVARDASARAVVVIGAGRTFVCRGRHQGAGEHGLGRRFRRARDARLLQRIEDLPKPVVMAMHGTALGGGLEVAMAGHYRVAVSRRADGTARGEPRHHPGRGGHAAAAAPGRRREGDRDVRIRQADQGEGRARCRPRSIGSSTATSRPVRVAFAREMASAHVASEDARADRQASASRGHCPP